MLKKLRRINKYLFRNRYIRCLHSARKISLEHSGKKVLITDSKKDDQLICIFLKWMKVDFRKCCFTETLYFLKEIDYNEYYIWVTMCPELRKKISNIIDCGVDIINIHYIYYSVPKLDINLLQDVYDIQLGFTREDDVGSFTVWGDYDNADKKIVILGNSTSDATFAFCKSWGEYLYEKLKANGINISILCGAMIRVNSSQELLKLIRDVIPQEPSMVINVSGVCNIDVNYRGQLMDKHPYIWKYQEELFKNKKKIKINKKDRVRKIAYGLENKKSYAQWWVDDMRMMYAICTEFDIKYWAILQPNMYMGDYKITGLEHTSKNKEYPYKVREWYEEVKKLIGDKTYIIDFTNIYNGYKNIYWDTCHVYENGNRIMAESVYQLIKDIL